MSDVHVTGLSDLQKFLDELPAKLEKNIMRGALRAGINEIRDTAVATCPVGPPSPEGARLYGLHTGSLRDSIRIGTVVRGGQVMATLKVGGKTAKAGDVWYAHIIEFTGAVPHVIKAKNGGALAFAGGVYQSVNHPGMKAQPFLRPALDSRAQDAVVAAAEYMKERLATKEGLDTAGIVIEGDV